MSGSSSTNTQDRSPWAPTQGALKAGIAEATDLYNSGGFTVNPYQGDMVANLDANTLSGLQGLVGAIPGVSDAISGAQGVFSGIAGQDMNAVKQGILADIMPAINSTFAGSGMTGSSLHQQNLAKGLSAGMADAQMGINNQQMNAAQRRSSSSWLGC